MALRVRQLAGTRNHTKERFIMNLALKKTTCRALVVSLLALSFQTARAGLISPLRIADFVDDADVRMAESGGVAGLAE